MSSSLWALTSPQAPSLLREEVAHPAWLVSRLIRRLFQPTAFALLSDAWTGARSHERLQEGADTADRTQQERGGHRQYHEPQEEVDESCRSRSRVPARPFPLSPSTWHGARADQLSARFSRCAARPGAPLLLLLPATKPTPDSLTDSPQRETPSCAPLSGFQPPRRVLCASRAPINAGLLATFGEGGQAERSRGPKPPVPPTRALGGCTPGLSTAARPSLSVLRRVPCPETRRNPIAPAEKALSDNEPLGGEEGT